MTKNDSVDEVEDREDGRSRERTEELERERKFEVFAIPEEVLLEYRLPEGLPTGVAVAGGMARRVARRVITGDSEPAYELDLVYIPELADADNLLGREDLKKVTMEYIPNSPEYEIEIMPIEDYFATRDFTINQCLVVGDKLMATRAAYDDLQENVIRPSYFERESTAEQVNDRLFLKALLLSATLRDATSSYPTIADLDEDFYRWNGCGDRDVAGDYQVALVLNKAMSQGVRPARYLTELLVNYGVTGKEYLNQPMKLGRAIIRDSYTEFRFRPMNGDVDEIEADFAANEVLEDGVTAADTSMSSKTQTELSAADDVEYWGEPTSGQYTQKAYDWINRGEWE